VLSGRAGLPACPLWRPGARTGTTFCKAGKIFCSSPFAGMDLASMASTCGELFVKLPEEEGDEDESDDDEVEYRRGRFTFGDRLCPGSDRSSCGG
jgi:hypothetical protein